MNNPERTKLLLSSIGSPQQDLHFIHVCGSNGKGSVCALLDSVLRAAGYRVGLFTSPHLQDERERIKVNGKMISREAYDILSALLEPEAEKMTDKPGYFCFLTALGIGYFAQQHCDFVILETGIGGTYDSTNAIDSPELTVVTNIGLEHTELLGSTVTQIARDKAGIIKPGTICAAYDQDPEVMDVIRKACKKNHVPLHVADFSSVTKISDKPDADPLDGQFIKRNGILYKLALLGSFQINNAALALTAIDALRERGWLIPNEAVNTGFQTVRWPARFEVLSRNPLLILDGGHNPQCARALIETLDVYFPNQRVIFLTGFMKDKNYREIINILMPKADHFYCVTPPDTRGLPAEDLTVCLRQAGARAHAYRTTAEALHRAQEEAASLPVIVFGSLYLAGEIRDLIGLAP